MQRGRNIVNVLKQSCLQYQETKVSSPLTKSSKKGSNHVTMEVNITFYPVLYLFRETRSSGCDSDRGLMLTLINSFSLSGHDARWWPAQYGQCLVSAPISGLKTASRGLQMPPASPGGLAHCLPPLSRTIMAQYFSQKF